MFAHLIYTLSALREMVEKCRNLSWHFLTILDVAPFHWPLLRSTDKGSFGTKKNMRAGDNTGSLSLFSARKSGNYLDFLGGFHDQNYTGSPGGKGKIHWRNFKNSSGERLPKLQIPVARRGRMCLDLFLEGAPRRGS